MSIPIHSWVHSLAKHFDDDLLTVKRIIELRQSGLAFLAREDQELLGFVALHLLSKQEAAIIGLWVAEEDSDYMDTGTNLVSAAINHAHTKNFGVIVPGNVLHYVSHEMQSLKDAGMRVPDIHNMMTRAGVPRKHPVRHASLKIARPCRDVVRGTHTVAMSF